MKNYSNLREMKQDYQTIPMPKNLEERVKLGISNAKKETETKRHFYQRPSFWMKSGGCVVAAMAAFTLLVNFNTPIAHAMSQIPVLGSVVKVVSFQTIELSSKDMKAKVNIPEVAIKDTSGKENKEASKKLNDSVKEYTAQIIQQYKKDVEETKGEGKEEVSTDYKVVTDNSRLFSLKFNTNLIAANTSGNMIKIYHVDKATGKIITLKNIFDRDSNYLDILTQEIKKQMHQQMAKDDQKTYFIDNADMPEDNWKGLTDAANFYINKKGELTILFDKYEVAPGYMGFCKFTIPSDVIKDIVHTEYLK